MLPRCPASMQQSALLLDRAAGPSLKASQPTRVGRSRSRFLSASLYEFSPSVRVLQLCDTPAVLYFTSCCCLTDSLMLETLPQDIELGARLGTSRVLDLTRLVLPLHICKRSFKEGRLTFACRSASVLASAVGCSPVSNLDVAVEHPGSNLLLWPLTSPA